jgi:hypothetical protein
MKSYLLERLKEPSTWRGLTALLTAVVVALSPDQVNAIVSAGLALMGVLGVFTKDKGNV